MIQTQARTIKLVRTPLVKGEEEGEGRSATANTPSRCLLFPEEGERTRFWCKLLSTLDLWFLRLPRPVGCKVIASFLYSVKAAALTVLMMTFIATSPVTAQENVNQVFESLRSAFADGAAADVLERAAGQLDLTVLGVNALYSRSQATYVLDNFFRLHPPQRCILQAPSEAAGNWFVTGSYRSTNSEQPFSVYLRLSKKGTEWELREIRIDLRSQD